MRHAVLMILLLIGLNGIGQPPMPFPHGEAQWTVNQVSMGNSSPDRIYATMGDTLIGADLFTKIGWVENSNTPFEPEDLVYHGAMKDADGQWSFIPEWDDATYVLFDFTGAVGDTVTIWNPGWGFGPAQYIVQAIDELQQTGGPRRLWTLQAVNMWLGMEFWLEGMGSLLSGLFGHASSIQDAGYMLVCFEQDGLLVYREPAADSCFYSLVGIEELERGPTALTLHPNPASTWVQLELAHGILPPVVSVELRDMTGRLLLREAATTNNGTVICDVSQMEPGAYLAAVVDNSGQLATGRVVVAR